MHTGDSSVLVDMLDVGDLGLVLVVEGVDDLDDGSHDPGRILDRMGVEPGPADPGDAEEIDPIDRLVLDLIRGGRTTLSSY